jgi:hypothetical protein
MESFIVLDPLYAEYVSPYVLPLYSRIVATRVSPGVVFSETYGYIRVFDELRQKVCIMEEDAWRAARFEIEVVHPAGCHVQAYPTENGPYLYTLPHKTRSAVVHKQGDHFLLENGGWIQEKTTRFYPKKKKMRLFRLVPLQKKTFVGIEMEWWKGIVIRERKWFPGRDHLYYVDKDGRVLPAWGVLPLRAEETRPIKKSSGSSCILCSENQIDTSVLHLGFAHSFSCSACIEGLRSNSCPVCRLPIEQIITNHITTWPE